MHLKVNVRKLGISTYIELLSKIIDQKLRG
ncbi:hypothetical protein DYY66_0565 [Candidatus Nitrosotalea sp. FS]|nr:hypothetical protein [Candidatus Nitrosotalea sp. FS]